MNAVTIIEAAAPAAQDEWMSRGRDLATQRLDVDWRLADWMSEGKHAGFITQSGFDFLSENLGLAPKRLKDALKAAESFPRSLRDTSLSIEHHAALASLPRDEALPLLQRASSEHLPVNALREYVTQRRYETGQNFADDDTDGTLCTHIVRAWNRATPAARQSFLDLQEVAHLGIIDEDEPC